MNLNFLSEVLGAWEFLRSAQFLPCVKLKIIGGGEALTSRKNGIHTILDICFTRARGFALCTIFSGRKCLRQNYLFWIGGCGSNDIHDKRDCARRANRRILTKCSCMIIACSSKRRYWWCDSRWFHRQVCRCQRVRLTFTSETPNGFLFLKRPPNEKWKNDLLGVG
jgi:hypothetical protein